MCDEWMPTIKLQLTKEEYRQLPRNAAYRYDWLGDEVYLTPKPRHYHALLTLRAMPVSNDVDVKLAQAQDEDLEPLLPVFAATFRNIQPYGSLDDPTRLQASQKALERTRTGGDGPWIRQASFVARQEDKPVGAILITLLPDGDPCDWDSYLWLEPPPPDCLELGLGRPHLTWVFVSPLLTGQGIGSALLAQSVQALLDLGYQSLLTTFMIGNDSSMLWHWRHGFQLLSHPGSLRQAMKRRRRRSK